MKETRPATDLAALRRNYALNALKKADAPGNPFQLFDRWMHEAIASEILEPNAMTLATAAADGRPSARIVLLKGVDENGFVFFTNYESRKGDDLAENPRAALLFAWLPLERQVRIEGRVEKVPVESSKAYFQSRPRASQVSAWASPQSRVLGDREYLEEITREVEDIFKNETVLPLPPYWGGYRVIPHEIEFWQGRESRLHDRLLYAREEEGWTLDRLAP